MCIDRYIDRWGSRFIPSSNFPSPVFNEQIGYRGPWLYLKQIIDIAEKSAAEMSSVIDIVASDGIIRDYVRTAQKIDQN